MSSYDVVLIHPGYSYPDKSPPLGPAYLQAYLKKRGAACRLVDIDALGLSFETAVSKVAAIKPAIIGISFMTNQAVEANRLATELKRFLPETVLIGGGCHVSAVPGEIDTTAFDAYVVGEGEESFYRLVSSVLGSGKLPVGAPGIKLRGGPDSEVVKHPLIEDLDALPFPDQSDLPVGRYGTSITGSRLSAPVFSVLSSRGCPNDCIFCASKCVFERRFRKRSAENIFRELAELSEDRGAKLINFVDDTLTVDRRRLLKLCGLIAGNLRLEWMCNARVNTVDAELLTAMAEAGCKNICFGVESGDPEVLKRIKKGVTLDQIRSAHHLARSAGLAVSSYFMVGNPGETTDSIRLTVELAAEISDNPSVSIATPYPGTELHKIAKTRGWITTTDWSRYVTTPHVLPDYRPVAVNGSLSARQLLEAYYYVNRKFMRQKLATRYGRRFYFNRRFYSREMFGRARKVGIGSLVSAVAKLASGSLGDPRGTQKS